MVVKTNENGFFLSLLYFIPLGIIQLERSHGVYRLCPPSKRIASFSLSFPLVLFSFLRSMLLDNKFYSHYTNSNNSNTNDLIFFFGKLFPNFSIQDKNQLIEKKMIIYNTEFETRSDLIVDSRFPVRRRRRRRRRRRIDVSL